MPNWSTDYISALLSECGAIALSYYDKPGTEMKGDKSLVTEADHAVEALLAQEFHKPEDKSYLIGEETVDTMGETYLENAFSGKTWIVDPIDGTSCYAHHVPTWGISIGLMEDGRFSKGAIFLPITGEMFINGDEGVLYGTGFAAGKKPDRARFNYITTSPVTERSGKAGREGGMIAISQVTAKYRRFDTANPIQALGCAVLPLSYVLLGRYLAYVGAVKLWDVAGVFPLLQSAGYDMRLVSGYPITDALDPQVFRLDPEDEKRWYLREDIVCARTRADTDYVLAIRNQQS